MSIVKPVPWTPAEDVKLARLWAEGHSTSLIGEMMGRKKNSVISHAHRLAECAPRPSPIKRHTGNVRSRTPKPRAPKVTLQIAMPLAIAANVIPLPVSSSRRCCWPMWGSEKPTHRYCDAAVNVGRSYCPTHHALAHTNAPEPIVADVRASAGRVAW